MSKELTVTQKLNGLMENNKVKAMFENALGDNADIFVSSMIELVGNDTQLQKCNPNDLMMEALKSAVLNLPINKDLGFSYIIAYKGKPQFQLGVHGVVQLALRTSKYKTIHSGTLYEGQLVTQDYLTGDVKITGEPSSDKAIGYFAHFELINGFKKSIFWSVERVMAHAKKYSQAYTSKYSPWQTAPNEMGKKTMLKRLLKKYGIMTTSMTTAFTGEETTALSPSGQLQQNVDNHANQGDVIDLETDFVPENPLEQTDKDKHVEKAEERRTPGF